MNKIFKIFLVMTFFSCNSNESKNSHIDEKNDGINNSEVNAKTLNEDFNIDPKTLTKDFITWYNYTYYQIRLSQNFIGLDIDSSQIDKLSLLKKLQLGNQIPLKIKIVQGQPVYKLYNLGKTDESIKNAIKQMATTEIAHLKMEGTDIPDFDFTDLNGNNYSKPSTKGKLMVLKCWFVHCTACVKEFPELNKLVDENKDVSKVLFVSLAMDSKQDLQNFLKTKDFKYAVVPNTKNYMTDKLGITEYPTHLLINTEGKIIKVVNRIEDLIPFLNREKSKI
jgi:peroxiredoxin